METKFSFSHPSEHAAQMGQILSLDNDRIQKMLDIKVKVFNGELKPDEARKLVNETFSYITAEEFALGEQQMLDFGITNETMVDGMDDILDVFKDVLTRNKLNLREGHPIMTYAQEADALEHLVLRMENQLKKKFIKNEWLELYEKLSQINIHFSRKQHQLFSALENVGFDRPSKVMWTFDNKVRDAISAAFDLLRNDQDAAFIAAQGNVFFLVRDILDKERSVLYPTSLKLLSDDTFAKMRISDDEIGYCLISTPPAYGNYVKEKEEIAMKEEGQKTENQSASSLIEDLQAVLQKHGLQTALQNDEAEVLDVATGKLTLKQINLIFKHLQVDLSYVDENEIVKFYSDTKHRVFPRSAGVIGRMVQNCHPRESVSTVEAIIEAFRNGEQDKAEFWINKPDKFIYIIYNAVRDEDGKFCGVLEMMQDVTHIRNLTGSRKLLTWDNEQKTGSVTEETESKFKTLEDIHEKTIIGSLVKEYPFIKGFLLSLSPQYKDLDNPAVFNIMKDIAQLDMIAQRGNFEPTALVEMIRNEVKNHQS